MPERSVAHNAERSRFEADVDGHTAVLEYRRDGDVIVLTHTEVPPQAEGQGVGSALARAALDYAGAHGLRVRPYCAFVAAYVRRHSEYEHLVG